MRIQPGDTNDHTLTEGDLNIADTETAWVRFALYISDDFAATANDIFNIFEWQQAGGTVEACISLQVVAATDVVNIAIADGTEASSGFVELTKGQWNVIEALFTVDVTPGTNGVLTLYVNGNQVQSVTGHNQAAAVGQGVLGTQNTLATTSTGYLLFDEFAFDDTRVGITHRFHKHRVITTSSFAFVGPGQLSGIRVIDGGGGDVTMNIFDTDEYISSLTPVWYGQTGTADVGADATDEPIEFSRGCLVVLAGTTPAAQVTVGKAKAWGSDGAVRRFAYKRTPARYGQ